jgi:hypothetical protein
MTPAEVAQLLTIDANITGRPLDQGTVNVWHGILRNIPADLAYGALRDHYAESEKWVMPANILTRARWVLSRQREERQRAEIEAAQGTPADRERVRAICRQLADSLPSVDG